MLRLARFRGPAMVVGGLLAWLLFIDVALTAAVGFTGRWFPNAEAPVDSSVLSATGGKISRVLAQNRPVGLGTETPLGVLLGQSSLGAAVTADVVDEKVGPPMQWLNIHGWGTSINLIRDVSELLVLSGLKPNVVVIAINPYMLVGTNFPTDHVLIIKKEGKRFKPWIWIYNNRYVINHSARMLTHRVKLAITQMFGVDFRALFPPAFAPKSTRERLPAESEEERAERLDHCEKLGWFDPGRYSPNTPNSRSLVALIREHRAAGAKVCIILMPEHSEFRKRIPAEALHCFAEINRIDFPHDPVVMYDLRARLADNQFLDVVHASMGAMEACSILVADCISDFLSGHPSPEQFRGPIRSKPSGGAGDRSAP